MQAISATDRWIPPVGTLGELTKGALERAEVSLPRLSEWRARAADQAPARPFVDVLRGPTLRVIAEVKRSSPSKGAIAPGLNAADQAERYVRGGAAAISVLTEPTRFGGALTDLADVSSRVSVPAIRKDFIVAPVQLWEARAHGASAALLIVRALSHDSLRRLVESAQEIGLELLVEIRDEQELARAVDVGARVIGVNNRNLETLVIDTTTAPTLIPSIPSSCIAVAESGMQVADDAQPAAAAGADALLVGSAISASPDPTAAVAAFSIIPRRSR